MRPSACRSSFRAILVLAAALALLGHRPALAQEGADYTISEDDGYGIAECMHSGRACGQVIADSWCESHGHAHALAFGLGSDVTGSVAPAATSASPVVKVAASDVVIRCGD